jgi:hypothetical protein
MFQQVLGAAWVGLPFAIRQLHSATSVSMYSGRCTVTQGRNLIARAVTALVGFPKPGTDLVINVKLCVASCSERWVRTVADREFSSTLSLPKGRSAGLVREQVGPVAIDMSLVAQTASIEYIVRRWKLLGVPMPLWLGPKTIATESIDAQERFRFDIKIWHPFIGTLVHYAGWLRPAV